MPEHDSTPESKGGGLSGILSMPNDSMQKTLFVAIALCLVCSVVVASAAVFLKPIQVANQALDVKKNILDAAGLYEEGMDVNAAFDEKVEVRVVNLDTGEYAEDIDPATFDQRQAAADPDMSQPVPLDQDIAKVKRRPNYGSVYLIKEGDELKSVILPVQGYGLWSMMYAFLALESDLNTVQAVKFYEQGETAGLGGEVANPNWQSIWVGKKVFDEGGKVNFEVIKGAVASGSPNEQYEVDGLAGSTLTSRGVTNMMHYWLGESGFGPYLSKLKNEQGGGGDGQSSS